MSPNGKPLFRVIWGADRFTVVGGTWKKYDENDNYMGEVVEERFVTKYPQFEERWIMEMWCPPENYGNPDDWETATCAWIDGKKIHMLGPFPREGEYELLKVLETPEHKNKAKSRQYVPLTSTVVDAMIAVAKMNQHLPKTIRMEYVKDQREKKLKREEEHRSEILAKYRPAFREPYVVVPQQYEKRSESGRLILP